MSLFLGIDAGTQSIKAELIDVAAGTIAGEAQVHFGSDLPQYASPNGYLESADETIRHADPLMWVDALELLLQKLQEEGCPLDRVAGISGSGQQHGSVYLAQPITLEKSKRLSEQLRSLLSRPTAPIWMDHSTVAECAELEAKFGSRLQQDTGSPAAARFTGPQIRKFFKDSPEQYAATKRIHLVSSFLCSLLIGKDAPIDTGDGAGMNLLNLHFLQYDAEITEFTAPGLMEKLPPCVPGDTVVGGVDPYFEKYGLRAGTPVVVFSGDNPNSLAGMGATAPGAAVISLGTSDTFFVAMPEFKTDPAGCGHVFGNPAGGFMSLICFANGSLTREEIKKQYDLTWDFFDREACAITQPGNGGRLMLPYFVPESTPPVAKAGVKYNFDPATATAAEMVRCILESQALAMRSHAAWQGGGFSRIRITGGASGSRAFRQILANVFQAEIESIEVVNSAALGAALRAGHGIGGIAWEDLYGKFCRTTDTVTPQSANRQIYHSLLKDFIKLETSFLKTE